MRVRSEAKVATMIRPSALRKISSRFFSTVFSESVLPVFLGVRAVYGEGVDTDLPDAFKFIQAVRDAVFVVFNAEIGEVNHVADGSFQNHAGRFGNGVRHAEEFGVKIIGNFYLVAVLHDFNVNLRAIGIIFLPLFHDCLGDGRCIDRRIAEFLYHVRNGADVVVVARA